MITLLRSGVTIIGIVLILGLVWFNARIYSVPRGSAGRGMIAEDAMAQLANIRRRLRAGEGSTMQRLFPEGWFFSHALYGFAWINVGLQTTDQALRDRAATEARWVLQQMATPEGMAPFLQSTQVEHGVFYLGWKNRLLGGLLALQPDSARNTVEVDDFKRNCELLAAAFRATPTLHLDAYPGQAWPCDNVMALTSLRLHDDLFGMKYDDVIKSWLSFTNQHLDPDTALVVHRIDGPTGAMLTAARASTQVYILSLLPEISPDFARDQYEKFRQLFVADWLGYLPVREYPKGRWGKGDVDTGPLILGISPSATVVSIAAARANGDFELAERSIILSETVGAPWTSGDEKCFGFGRIVVADAFLVWGKTLVPWSHTAPTSFASTTPTWWRWRIHAISLLTAALVWLALRRMHRSAGQHRRTAAH